MKSAIRTWQRCVGAPNEATRAMGLVLASWLGIAVAFGGGTGSIAAQSVPNAPRAEARRVAIVVGANEAPAGRRPLRYGHRDARGVGRVLRHVGGFGAEDVHVLLDPSPATVLSLLDGELRQLSERAGESLLLFYYSGHADEQALFPNGEQLLYRDLRRRLENDDAAVRVGVIDACRGGGWTGTRGLTETEAFEVNVPFELNNEGSVLIASSSGLEDAHESEELRGGFFTHHWNAALRGAGDRNGDRSVSLQEAFNYAKRLTIRDTSLHTETPQHPSFRLNLSGRRDLPLARLAGGNATVTIQQRGAPMQLVHLDTGDVVLELTAAERDAELAIAPGRYLVRTVGVSPTKASEIRVRRNRPTVLSQDDMETVDQVFLASRGIGGAVPPVTLSTLPAGTFQLQGAIGVARDDSVATFVGGDSSPSKAPIARITFAYGITDHVQLVLPLPGLAFRKSIDRVDLVPWAGFHDSRIPVVGSAPGFGFYGETVVNCGAFGSGDPCGREPAFSQFLWSGALGVGLDGRYQINRDNSFLFGASVRTPIGLLLGDESSFRTDFGEWIVGALFGGSYLFDNVVTLTLTAQWEQRINQDQGPVPALRVGSMQGFGLRPVPLLRVHATEQISLDVYVSLTYDFNEEGFEEVYMAGSTVVW